MEKHWSADLIKSKVIIILLFLIFILLCLIVSVGLFTDRHIKLFGIEFNSEKKYPIIQTDSTNKKQDENHIEIKKDTFIRDRKPANSFQQTKTPTNSKFSYKNPSAQKVDSVKAQPIVNITSNHQTGGITAQSVTIGVKPQPRILNFDVKKQLFEFLNDKNEIIEISSVNGDVEAYNYALEITHFLQRNGYTKVNIGSAFFNPPIEGQQMNRVNNQTQINIGSQKTN
ncbi:hypothetical protein [Flavobacterium sp. ASV13]|uniref:hypothetical protein n=1 Tax=Flavobacterium sp. ASV13 TaxID=1506583 RepID=UPI0005559828|nr:hypothetical protein [Flavobacterium sp. ASV13]